MILPDDPTCIVVSVSGGVDSQAAAVWARHRWPDHPLILWHSYLHRMDWPQTGATIDQLAERLGNCYRVTVQPVYELTGGTTKTGMHSTELRALHDVEASGPLDHDGHPTILRDLLDFTTRARHGMPPTSKLRYCTAYFKRQVFDAWARRHRTELGEHPILLSGERRRESSGRAKLVATERRLPMADGWHIVWHRPVIDLALHEVVQLVTDAGVELHPGYFAQGETLAAMLDRTRDERGRARLSCVVCIFSGRHHVQAALQRDPEHIAPAVERITAFERTSGFSWKQDGRLDIEC